MITPLVCSDEIKVLITIVLFYDTTFSACLLCAPDMETDEKKAEVGTASGSGAAAAEAPAKKEEEPTSFTLEAPCRVIPSQVSAISFLPDSRWVSVKQGAAPVGFLVLKDTQPGEPVEYASSTLTGGSPAGVQQQAAAGAAAPAGGAAQEQEPPPPEPFGE
jgi:26S proteasome regulatory subunit N2